MQIEKRDGTVERRILQAMIVDDSVLAQIAAHWQKDLMQNRWAAIVGGWCVKFYLKYDRAPKDAIEPIFTSWAERQEDKDTVDIVESFLEKLSGEYETLKKEINSKYVIDLAGQHFNKIKTQRLVESIQEDLENGDIESAQNKWGESPRIEMGVGAGIDVLSDQNAIKSVFEERREPLIVYPQALKHFFADALERDAFIAFMGPEKRGKSFWLQDMAYRGMWQGRKVAYFQVGDMSQNQVMNRFLARANKRPLKASDQDRPPTRLPTSLERDPDSPIAQVEFEEMVWKKELDWKSAYNRCQEIMQARGGSLRLSCHPNTSISVNGINSILQAWDRKGWSPDVIVIDYADILAPMNSSANIETRDQINATWNALRALSQSRHCLVVTATQAAASSYSAQTIGMGEFSNDKRKFAHVTGMVGINQTIEEKADQLARLNWVVLRESDFDTSKCVHVAECRAIANPCVHSVF